MPTQLHDMHSKSLTSNFSIGHLSCEFHDKFASAFNVTLLLILIPVLNFVLYPFLREYMPNMLKRIGMGVFLALLTQVSILAVSGEGSAHRASHEQCMFSANFSNHDIREAYQYSTVSEFYALLPQILITIAEVLINVTSKFRNTAVNPP